MRTRITVFTISLLTFLAVSAPAFADAIWGH